MLRSTGFGILGLNVYVLSMCLPTAPPSSPQTIIFVQKRLAHEARIKNSPISKPSTYWQHKHSEATLPMCLSLCWYW
jgi:hypothetical protein